MIKKPLSETKRGKLLASIAGIAGGPAGVLVSPLVLILINNTKKNGNRYLVWGLIGVPISVILLFIQLIPLLLWAFVQPPSESNGMSIWAGSQEAKRLMQEPDWCVYTYMPGPPDDYSYFYCYKRDMGTLAKNDHQVISCYDEGLDGNLDGFFNCSRVSNKQFSTEEMNENKRLYGPQ